MLRLVLCQGPVAPQVPCLMDREATAAPLLGAESLTPVTQGTGWLQVVLVEHVSQMVSGQGVIQHVLVSAHYCALPLQQHTDAIILHSKHGHFKPQATVVLLALFLWMEGELSLGIRSCCCLVILVYVHFGGAQAYCNWKTVSNVDDELGTAVLVLYMPPISLKFVHNHRTASTSSSGVLAPHKYF